MRKRAIMAFMLAAAMLLSSCALVEKDLAVDNATVIIQLGDQTITKAQVNNAVDYQLYNMALMYSLYGYNIDTTDEYYRNLALEDVYTSLSQSLVKNQKAKELGFNVFTDEEDAALREKAQANFDSDKDYVKSTYFADTTLEGEELETAISDKMTELGMTFDYYYSSAKSEATEEKLRNSVIEGVAVTDEEIQAEYDEHVADAKASYEGNLSSYGYTVNNGNSVYYNPAGYRYVKHILRKFPTETQNALSDLKSKVNEKASQITSLESSISSLGEDVAQDAPERVKLEEEKAAAEKEKADLQAQYDKALEDACLALQPTVDEVLAKIAAGEDFDKLMETYGEDPGMQSSPGKENGYAVCQDYIYFDTAFVEAAMALAKVNDVSPAVRGQNGIHIIKYVSDIQEGPVPLEKVKDEISAELLSAKQDEVYNAQVEEWVAQSGIKVYKERMNQ